MRKLTRQETETIIRRSESDGFFDVYSDIPRDIRRILRAAEAFGCEVHKTAHGGIRCRLPVRALTFRANNGSQSNIEGLRRWMESGGDTNDESIQD